VAELTTDELAMALRQRVPRLARRVRDRRRATNCLNYPSRVRHARKPPFGEFARSWIPLRMSPRHALQPRCLVDVIKAFTVPIVNRGDVTDGSPFGPATKLDLPIALYGAGAHWLQPASTPTAIQT